MATFQIEHGGKTYEVDAPNAQEAYAGFSSAMGLAAPAPEKGELEQMGTALKYGAANAMAGTGASLEYVPSDTAKGAGKTIRELGESLAPKGYDPAGSKVEALSPSTWKYLPRALAESAPGLGASLGIGAMTGGAGFLLSEGAQHFGPNLNARRANNGGAEPTSTDYAAAGASTVAEAALARLGLKGAAGAVPKGAGAASLARVPGQVAVATGEGAAAGAAGNAVNQVGRTAGTDAGLDVNTQELANNALISGAASGAVRTARTPGDVLNAVKFREFGGKNTDSSGRVAEAFNEAEVQAKNPSDAYQAMGLVEAKLKSNLKSAKEEANAFIKSEDAKALIDEVQGQLNQGAKLTKSQISDLETSIGSHSEGRAVIEGMRDLSTLNAIKRKGNWNDAEKTFGGGLSSTALGQILNPVNTLKRPLANVLGFGLTGLAGAGIAPQLAGAAGIYGGLLGSQAAAYGGVRAIDKFLGTRNPTKQFVDRFSGLEGTPAPSGPSFNAKLAEERTAAGAAQEALRAEKARAKLDNKAKGLDNQLAKSEEDAARQGEDADKVKASQIEKAWRQQQAGNVPRVLTEKQLEAVSRRNTPSEETPREAKAWLNSRDPEPAKPKIEDAPWVELLDQIASRDRAKSKLEADNAARVKREEEQAKTADKLKAEQVEKAWRKQQAGNVPKELTEKQLEAVSRRNAPPQETPKEVKEWLNSRDPQPGKPQIEDKPWVELLDQLASRERAKSKLGDEKPKAKESPAGDFVKARKAKAKLEEAPNPEAIRITERGYTVERPKEAIKNPKAYITATRRNIRTRADFADALTKLAPEGKAAVKEMMEKLNNQAKSFKEAMVYIEDAIMDGLPEKHVSPAGELFEKHKAALKGTFKHD